MKSNARASSTSATPARKRFTFSPPAAFLGIASTTVFSLPAALAHFHGDPRMGLLVGLSPLLPYALGMAFVVAAVGAVTTVALLVLGVYIAAGRGDPGECLRALYTWPTNAVIGYMTLKPVSFPVIRLTLDRPANGQRPPSSLPAAPPSATRQEDTPVFFATKQEMNVQLDRPAGKHAKPETPEDPGRAADPMEDGQTDFPNAA